MSVFYLVTWGFSMFVAILSIIFHHTVSQKTETKSEAVIKAILFCILMPPISFFLIPIVDSFIPDEIYNSEGFGEFGNGLITLFCVIVVGFLHNIIIVVNSIRFFKKNKTKK